MACDGVFTPDSKHVATWFFRSPYVTVWNIETRTEVAVLKVAPEFTCDAAISPNGRLLATVGDDDHVKFWRVGRWTSMPTVLAYHHKGCNFARFSSDGKSVITFGVDGLLKVWDAPTSN